MAAEIEHAGKVAPDVVEPLGEAMADLAQQEIVLRQARRRPVAMGAHGTAVERPQGVMGIGWRYGWHCQGYGMTDADAEGCRRWSLAGGHLCPFEHGAQARVDRRPGGG
jgi:hypothetical protein